MSEDNYGELGWSDQPFDELSEEQKEKYEHLSIVLKKAFSEFPSQLLDDLAEGHPVALYTMRLYAAGILARRQEGIERN